MCVFQVRQPLVQQPRQEVESLGNIADHHRFFNQALALALQSLLQSSIGPGIAIIASVKRWYWHSIMAFILAIPFFVQALFVHPVS